MSDEEYADIKIVALMSVPMCGWNPHWGSVSEALRPFQIPIRLAYGAYWHASLSNLLQDCMADGIDWVLTLDYDSMFTAEHLDQLIGRFGRRSDIDALAALQCKRGTDEVPLLTAGGKIEIEVNGEPLKVDTAHFGLTLIRMDALRRVGMPWFLHVPDEAGSYATLGRVDADIYFWRKWSEAGNTIYVEPLLNSSAKSLGIGHLQPMIAEFDEHGKPRHVHVNDWRKANRRTA